LKFSIVGASGVLMNMGMLFFLTEVLNLFYLVSSILAIEISIITNFILNDLWTWHDRKKENLFTRLMRYHFSVGITAVIINWLLLIILTEFFGLYYLISNLIGISAGTLSNFVINDLWTFRDKSE
jgi:dolichol-phosphate mannosyltransferase